MADTRKRILAVDDDLRGAPGAEAEPRQRGYDVQTAGSGEDAARADRARELRPVTPGREHAAVNGLEVCKQIRRTQTQNTR
jgi:DNA-binding response OmpR family regulator